MMPNKTIYVADADLPIFERAQELAGENLSATIVAALRRFVAAEETRESGFGEIVVKVGENGLFTQKQFAGRELAKLRLTDPHSGRTSLLVVYQTIKGRLALYSRTSADWSAWGQQWAEKWSKQQLKKHGHDIDVDWDESCGWSSWSAKGSAYRLDVFESADELLDHVPLELHAAAVRALGGNEIEILDI
jgi:EXLDI family protein